MSGTFLRRRDRTARSLRVVHYSSAVNTLHLNHRSHKLSIPPEAEAIAIRVDQVGESLELRPLLFVVRVLEAAEIDPLAGCLDLDEAD